MCVCRRPRNGPNVDRPLFQAKYNWSMSMSMSKTFIGGAVCRESESEAPAAEETLHWVVCSSEQFCFQMCLECGDGNGTFSRCTRWRQRVPDSWSKENRTRNVSREWKQRGDGISTGVTAAFSSSFVGWALFCRSLPLTNYHAHITQQEMHRRAVRGFGEVTRLAMWSSAPQICH